MPPSPPRSGREPPRDEPSGFPTALPISASTMSSAGAVREQRCHRFRPSSAASLTEDPISPGRSGFRRRFRCLLDSGASLRDHRRALISTGCTSRERASTRTSPSVSWRRWRTRPPPTPPSPCPAMRRKRETATTSLSAMPTQAVPLRSPPCSTPSLRPSAPPAPPPMPSTTSCSISCGWSGRWGRSASWNPWNSASRSCSGFGTWSLSHSIDAPARGGMMKRHLWILAALGMPACKEKPPPPTPPLPVTAVVWCTRGYGGGETRYAGSIDADASVALAFRVSGVFDEITQVGGADGRTRNLQDGDPVGRGDTLARLRQDEFRDQVADADATLRQAQAEFQPASELLQY